MLRALLADRFKLVVHAENRDAPMFALVVGGMMDAWDRNSDAHPWIAKRLRPQVL
jgi:uncharacterized protein (TIGR03435 family)